MKVCESCGNEISTKDGENKCAPCERKPSRKKAKKSQRDSIMESMGLVKVRGAMGGVYWE